MKDIHKQYDSLQAEIANAQAQTSRGLLKQRSMIWKQLDRKLEEIKGKLKAEDDRSKADEDGNGA